MKRHTQQDKKILYSHTDNKEFIRILKKIYGTGKLGMIDESSFSHKAIDLVICNNRMELLDTCISLCGYLHCPLMIVDHKIRPEHLNASAITKPAITHYKTAISKSIAESWVECDAVIGVDISNPKQTDAWKQAIEDIIQKPYKVKNYEEKYSNTH